MTQGQATDESWKEFTGLREQAKNVLDNPNATPNEVSEILEKLNKFEFTYKDKESGEEDKGSESGHFGRFRTTGNF